jgi:hypothetical protein
MFNPYSPNETYKALDEEMIRVYRTLESHEVGSKEYRDRVEQLSRLSQLKAEEKPEIVKPDTALIVGANLLGILLIIRQEHVNVVASKALGFILRAR